MKEAEERRGVYFSLNRFYWNELRKILWRHGVSPQEYFGYLVQLLATGDGRLHEMVEEVKRARSTMELKDVLNIIHTDEESIYSLIERGLEQKGNSDGK